MPLLAATCEAVTEDGYTGLLTLDTASIQVEASGYATSTRNVSATRSYPNLSEADVSLVPKSIEDSGRTLTLADVQWQEVGGFYNAAATYTGTASSKYATGYVVTANYVGEVTRISTDVITYTAVFSSTDPAPAEETTETPTETPQPTQESSSFTFDWKWLLIPLGLGALGCAGYFGQKGYKHYINKKRGYE